MTIDAEAAEHALDVFGALGTRPDDGIGSGTILLFGPREPGFWAHVTHQPEFLDGAPDPLDRWSERVISDIAARHDGVALFPFGVPARPFISWALRSGRAWQSPVTLLVHDTAGLMLSYRGAIFLPDQVPPTVAATRPCDSCRNKPCLSACPVTALSETGYDLDTCHGWLDQAEGSECRSRGCAVRRSCPVSKNYGRSEAQSAFHMERFHPWR